ncbi:MAG: hypothetical protein WBE18_08445 [Gammaproteobacteria bacterium]
MSSNSQTQARKKKSNNYSISILLTSLIGGVLGAFVIVLHAFQVLDIITWVTNAIYGVNALLLTSRLVSGNGYLHMLFDRLAGDKTLFDRFSNSLELQDLKNPHTPPESFGQRLKKLFKTDFQFDGLWIGLVCAIALTVVQVVFHVSVPYDNVFSSFIGQNADTIISHSIMVLGNLSLFCGLGNRLGRTADYIKNSRALNQAENVSQNKTKRQRFSELFGLKDVHYTLSIIFGFLAGVALTIAIITTVSSAAFMTGGLLGVFIFGLTVISSSASASGYIGRIVDVLFVPYTYKRGKDTDKRGEDTELLLKEDKSKNVVPQLKDRIRKIESILTMVGVGIGIGVTILLLVTTTATLLFPFVGGLALLPTILLVTALSVSAFGGLGNRIGHMLDKFMGKQADGSGEQTKSDRFTLVPSINPTNPTSNGNEQPQPLATSPVQPGVVPEQQINSDRQPQLVTYLPSVTVASIDTVPNGDNHSTTPLKQFDIIKFMEQLWHGRTGGQSQQSDDVSEEQKTTSENQRESSP